LPLIGIGGIMSWKDAVEFMMAGATAVQMGTANFRDPAASELAAKGIEQYMKNNKISDINTIINSLKY
ncbi:MAG: dihydroorotate dehydrogenase, partial [Spirochaetia bacterium]|nr:dihydroorotate dehydrogenase [Spirochaetia bacterium]